MSRSSSADAQREAGAEDRGEEREQSDAAHGPYYVGAALRFTGGRRYAVRV